MNPSMNPNLNPNLNLNLNPNLNPNPNPNFVNIHHLNRVGENQSQNHITIDKARVTLLLEINSELIRETVQIQNSGKVDQEEKTSDKGFYG